MAFQRDPAFSGFLRAAARGGVLAETAPAVNFLLEERLAATREQDFLATSGGTAAWTVEQWWKTYANYYRESIACQRNLSRNIATFTAPNRDNHLPLESAQDVVRLESIPALFNIFQGFFDSAAQLTNELRA